MSIDETRRYGSQNEHRSVSRSLTEIPDQIGPYRLLEPLGSGGMGRVFVAQQEEPVQRRVALKLMSFEVSGPWATARFAVERQALALMNHPNIATVFDAGTEPASGRPYLVMELVDGEPLTIYCRSRRLSLRQQIEVFLQVCDGVHHAHQRMVIHRDLKPPNVLVTEHDGVALPKIIDFGIAAGPGNEMLAGSADDDGPAGTPVYMSPEQITGATADLDARTDVYALGVILYELLTSGVPYEIPAGGIAAHSQQLMTGRPKAPSIALQTRMESVQPVPALAPPALRRELDAIVLKAIEPDRENRYDSVASLRADLRRFLDGRAVMTYSSSTWYQLRKFFQRNRISVASGFLVVVALLVGITVSNIAMLRANRARLRAEAAEQNANATVEYLQRLLSSVDPSVDGRRVRVVDLLLKASQIISNDLRHQPEIEASVRKTIGWTFLELGMYDEARSELQTAYDIQQELLGPSNQDTLVTLNALGRLEYKTGRYREAIAIHRRVLAQQERTLGAEAPNTLWTRYNLAKALDKVGEWDEAEELYGNVLAARTRLLGPDHPHTLVAMNSLGLLLAHRGKLEDAATMLGSTLEMLTHKFGPEHPLTMNCAANLIVIYNQRGDFAAARQLAKSVLEAQKTVYGEDHPETLITQSELAVALAGSGQLEAAAVIARNTLERQTEVLGDDHPNTLETKLRLADIQCASGEAAPALEAFRTGMASARTALDGSGWRLATYESMYARCLIAAGEQERARRLLVAAMVQLDGSGRWHERRTREALTEISP